MSEIEIAATPSPLEAAWGKPVAAVVCPACDWAFLAPPDHALKSCPHCFSASLELVEAGVEGLPYTQPPELVEPFTLSPAGLEQSLGALGRGIPFAPADFTLPNLKARLGRVFLPVWLVDADVRATWQAEAGFNYQVVSHQERFDENRGGWATREVQETRVRWEPRLGRLTRSYTNVRAPAMEGSAPLLRALGGFDLEQSDPYRVGVLEGAVVRLPNRAPADAWSEATAAIQQAAAEECRQAARADDIRQFRWQPEFSGQNWTLLLLPVYSTFYRDDDGRPQPVWVQGQTGRIRASLRASMQRARRLSLILLGAAVLLFLLSLAATAGGVVAPPLAAAGAIGMLLALLTGLGAIVPVAVAWQFNRSHGEPLHPPG